MEYGDGLVVQHVPMKIGMGIKDQMRKLPRQLAVPKVFGTDLMYARQPTPGLGVRNHNRIVNPLPTADPEIIFG